MKLMPEKNHEFARIMNCERRICSLWGDLKRKPPILPQMAVRGSLQNKKILPYPMECSEWFLGHSKQVIFTKNVFLDEFVTNFKISLCINLSAILSSLKFPFIWDPWTAIWFKIGGFKTEGNTRVLVLFSLIFPNYESKESTYNVY